MSNVATETGYETIYELNELPRLFIVKNHPPAASEIARFQAKKRQISSMHDRLEADQSKGRYDSRYIARRTVDDTVLAKYLVDALSLSGHGNVQSALELIERAKRLDPAYSEVHRVEAMIHNWSGNTSAAWDSYETAVACEPNSAPLRYWYGGFLLRSNNDLDGARTQLSHAQRLEPDELLISLELGRVHMFAGEFELADQAIDPVVKAKSTTLLLRRKAFDTWLQSALRSGQQAFERGDYEQALKMVEAQIERFNEYSDLLSDERILTTMWKGFGLADSLGDKLRQTGLMERVEQCCLIISALDKSFGSSDGDQPPSPRVPAASDVGKRFHGQIVQYDVAKKFGFFQYQSAKRIFFHLSDVVDSQNGVRIGAHGEFTVALEKERHRAVEIELEAVVAPNSAQIRTGVIKTVIPDRNFGFIYDNDDGAELFFHSEYLADGGRFSELQTGSRVAFQVRGSARGNVAFDIREL
jgi:cold shock CspA family protein